MKKALEAIGNITTLGMMVIVIYCAYWVGTTQVETKESTPNGYIKLEQCIPLEDIGGYFINNNGYVCFELKDVENQLDNTNNKTYVDIIESLESITKGY